MTQFPRAVVVRGHLAVLSPNSFRAYLALLYEAKTWAAPFRASRAMLRIQTGLAPEHLDHAARELIAHGLLKKTVRAAKAGNLWAVLRITPTDDAAEYIEFTSDEWEDLLALSMRRPLWAKLWVVRRAFAGIDMRVLDLIRYAGTSYPTYSIMAGHFDFPHTAKTGRPAATRRKHGRSKHFQLMPTVRDGSGPHGTVGRKELDSRLFARQRAIRDAILADYPHPE